MFIILLKISNENGKVIRRKKISLIKEEFNGFLLFFEILQKVTIFYTYLNAIIRHGNFSY